MAHQILDLHYFVTYTRDSNVPLDLLPISAVYGITDVAIDGATDVDISTASAPIILALSSTTSLSTIALNATTSQAERKTVLIPQPISFTSRTGGRLRKRGRGTLPAQPTAGSIEDPVAATGLVVRALMGVAVTMDTPTIVDGKPT